MWWLWVSAFRKNEDTLPVVHSLLEGRKRGEIPLPTMDRHDPAHSRKSADDRPFKKLRFPENTQRPPQPGADHEWIDRTEMVADQQRWLYVRQVLLARQIQSHLQWQRKADYRLYDAIYASHKSPFRLIDQHCVFSEDSSIN